MRRSKPLIHRALLVAASLAFPSACSKPAEGVYRSVLDSWGPKHSRRYAFNPKPFCPSDPARSECIEHDSLVARQIQQGLPAGRARDGWSFRISPVIDSSGVKMIYLITMVDSISPEYGSSIMHQFILDSRGERVVSHAMVMGETTVRNRGGN